MSLTCRPTMMRSLAWITPLPIRRRTVRLIHACAGYMYVVVHSQTVPTALGTSSLAWTTRICLLPLCNVYDFLRLFPTLPTLKIIVAIGDISAAPEELLDAWSKQWEIRVITLAERKWLSERFCGRSLPCGSNRRDWRQVYW